MNGFVVKNPNGWGNRCEMQGETTGLMITIHWRDEHFGAIVDPQSALDTIHKMYPDLTFSPPEPKVGDRVRTPIEGLGDVRAIDADWVWVRLDKRQGPADAPYIYHRSIVDVVEQGK